MAARKQLTPNYVPQTAVADPYYGEYSALARQLYGGNEPVYSTEQGIANLLGDVGKAYFDKRALNKAKAREEKDYTDLAMAQQLATNTDAIEGISPQHQPGMPSEANPGMQYAKVSVPSEGFNPTQMTPQARAQAAMQYLGQNNPRLAVENGQGLMALSKSAAPAPPKYENVPGVGLVAIPEEGAPSVAIKAPQEEKRYSVGNTLVDSSGKVVFQGQEKGEKPKGAGQLYQDKFGGQVEAGMRPELGPDGQPTGVQLPIEGGSKDPAVIEAKRAKELEQALPKTQSALDATIKDLGRTRSVIQKLKMNETGVGDVTGFGGSWLGSQFTMPGGAGAKAQADIDQLKGKAFLSGLATLKAQSPTGATGLGAASEREGKAVTDAAAALNQAQSAEDYYAALDEYDAALADAQNNLKGAFESEFSPVIKKASPEGVDPNLWAAMTPEERALWK